MTWQADYSVVAPEQGDQIDLTGLVTMDNQSGKTFTDAKIKLMAGDVNKVDPNGNPRLCVHGHRRDLQLGTGGWPGRQRRHRENVRRIPSLQPAPAHHAARPRNQTGRVRARRRRRLHRFYVYDGVKIDRNRYQGYSYENIRNLSDYGTQSNPKVWTMREFKNSEANHLGLPLPKGRVRFYRRDCGRATGVHRRERLIDHTPKDETVRVFTGAAFDLTGERKRTAFKVDNSRNSWADEWFEIKLRNHKKEAVEIRVVEHLYRWTNWEISDNSDPFVKTDAQAIEFRVQVKPDEEKTLNYKVHYSW